MARLTAKQRNSLSTSSFALPGSRRYPIEDLAHARAALSRVSQFGSPAEKVQVRRAVYARYPQLRKT